MSGDEFYDKMISEVSDEAVEKNMSDRHFKKFVKALLYMITDTLEEKSGDRAMLDYFLNMRDSEGKPWEMNMKVHFSKVARKDGAQ